jgi:hypothetical protein
MVRDLSPSSRIRAGGGDGVPSRDDRAEARGRWGRSAGRGARGAARIGQRGARAEPRPRRLGLAVAAGRRAGRPIRRPCARKGSPLYADRSRGTVPRNRSQQHRLHVHQYGAVQGPAVRRAAAAGRGRHERSARPRIRHVVSGFPGPARFHARLRGTGGGREPRDEPERRAAGARALSRRVRIIECIRSAASEAGAWSGLCRRGRTAWRASGGHPRRRRVEKPVRRGSLDRRTNDSGERGRCNRRRHHAWRFWVSGGPPNCGSRSR